MKATCRHVSTCRGFVALLVVGALAACTGQQPAGPPATDAPSTSPAAQPKADAPIPATASPLDALPEAVRLLMDKPFTGDLDEMVKRHMIRVAVTFNRTHYFVDQGQERGTDVRGPEVVRDRSEYGI